MNNHSKQLDDIRHTVIVCGPIAIDNKPASGGFQAGNRKVISILRELDYQVVELAYPEGHKSRLEKFYAYSLFFLKSIKTILINRHRPCALHFTPLIKSFMAPEFFLCLSAKLARLGLVVDLRAGTQISHYKRRGPLYRLLYQSTLKLADSISYEGDIYADFVKSLAPGIPRFYLPNFVSKHNIVVRDEATKMDGPKLVYVGRVSEAKGALHAAKVLGLLKETYPKASLTLVGNVEKDIKIKLESLSIKNLNLIGPQSPEVISQILDQSHFFLFLTTWDGEGHSNALTEAMARGCIPVVTRHGFNETVVGESGIIIEDRDNVTDVISSILGYWRFDSWNRMSRLASDRVYAFYSDVSARKALVQMYAEIFNKQL